MNLAARYINVICTLLPIHKAIGGILVLLLFSCNAHAGVITYAFEGEVEFATGSPIFAVGDTFAGSYTFETTAEQLPYSDGDWQARIMDGDLYPGTGWNVSVNTAGILGNFSLSGTSGSMLLTDDAELWGAGHDEYIVTMYDGPATIQGYGLAFFQISLDSYWDDNMLTDVGVSTLPDLERCTSPSGRFFFNESPGGAINDQTQLVFTSLTAVPIPSAIWLLGSAFIGLVGFRKKLRKEA